MSAETTITTTDQVEEINRQLGLILASLTRMYSNADLGYEGLLFRALMHTEENPQFLAEKFDVPKTGNSLWLPGQITLTWKIVSKRDESFVVYWSVKGPIKKKVAEVCAIIKRRKFRLSHN